jgi:hypothetical protein
MRRTVPRLLLAAVLPLATAGLLTLYAVEGSEVVVLRTAGGTRSTRVWIADEAGVPLVEAATPERPFLRDLARDPTVTLVRGGRARRCRAAVLPNPEGHTRVRRLLRAKYGWADRWIALVTDLSRSVGVRLECEVDSAT